MPILLNIDTATEQAGVCISRDGLVLHMLQNEDQKNHASFLQPAIQQLLHQTGMELPEIDAVALTAGPGSYTGLRVGMASAKGICYALNKPLILINTLEVMAQAARAAYPADDPSILICPLIDARRMEVFTAVYDLLLQQILPPQAMILNAGSFSNLLDTHQLIFLGSGHQKLNQVLEHPNASFSDIRHHAGNLAQLAHKSFHSQHFTNLAYSEPQYVKAFFDPSGKR